MRVAREAGDDAAPFLSGAQETEEESARTTAARLITRAEASAGSHVQRATQKRQGKKGNGGRGGWSLLLGRSPSASHVTNNVAYRGVIPRLSARGVVAPLSHRRVVMS